MILGHHGLPGYRISPPLTTNPTASTSTVLVPFSTICSKVFMCHTKVISQHNDAFQFEVCGFVCDLAEQSWGLNAELQMQCWDWKSKKNPPFSTVLALSFSFVGTFRLKEWNFCCCDFGENTIVMLHNVIVSWLIVIRGTDEVEQVCKRKTVFLYKIRAWLSWLKARRNRNVHYYLTAAAMTLIDNHQKWIL